jgi:hypothetical protein
MNTPTPEKKQEIEAMVQASIHESRSVRAAALTELEAFDRLSRKEMDRRERAAALNRGRKRLWWWKRH